MAEYLHLIEYIKTFAQVDRLGNRADSNVESFCGGFAKAGMI